MQELRLVAVSEDGSYAVLTAPGSGGRFTLRIDDRLRVVARGQFARLAQYEIEVESPLRPKEIQDRIRAGETADEIADAAGVPIERVRRFEGPVLAERAYRAQEAQRATVRQPACLRGRSGGRRVGFPEARRRRVAGHARVQLRQPPAPGGVGLRPAPQARRPGRRHRHPAVPARRGTAGASARPPARRAGNGHPDRQQAGPGRRRGPGPSA